MPVRQGRAISGLLLVGVCAAYAQSPSALSWDEVRARFRTNNPTLAAGRLSVQESAASEVTAYLRPNPTVTTSLNQLTPFTGSPYRPFAYSSTSVSASYLHEREQKRELRRDNAKQATSITATAQDDQERALLFNARTAFVGILQAKSVLQLAQDNLAYYDRVLSVNQARRDAGDIARVDLDRLQLQKAQFETDLRTAEVNLRTAKIQLQALMNDHTPEERFDVTGTFDYNTQVMPLEHFRAQALEARPDLRVALQSIEKAKTDHQLAIANGSVDPVFSLDYGRAVQTGSPAAAYVGASITIPLRIFDRNQGEKARTQLEIPRAQAVADAGRLQVLSDVDSAYASINNVLVLLNSYRANYLDQAVGIRETISISYQNGGASLLEFMNAQNDYRNTQLNYLNLIGSYLTAANQLNFSVGREVIP